MRFDLPRLFRLALIGLLCVGLAAPALAAKGFLQDDDSKEDGEPVKWLKNYDKLVKGKEADWVYFAPGKDLRSYKTVVVKEFGSNAEAIGVDEKHVVGYATDVAKDYLVQWIQRSNLGWTVGDSGDLTIEGNIFNAWEPSTAARVWGGWLANPGSGMEIRATDSSGALVFEIRHKSRGSTVSDSVENALESIVETLEAGK